MMIENGHLPVRRVYSKAARRPKRSHPFPVGRRFAKSVGYPSELLKTIPKLSTESFSGVSNVSLFSDIHDGLTVLDLGWGTGLDAIVASRRVGPTGRVVGIDFSSDMVVKVGEKVWSAEMILKERLLDAHRRNEAAWFAWIGGAKEGGAFLDEFLSSGFSGAEILRTMRNAHTQHEAVIAAEIVATR